MAQGKRFDDKVRERARALLSSGNNASAVAKMLGLKYTTVKTWEKQWASDPEDGDYIEELRRKKKELFVNDAWDIIAGGTNLLQRRINRAMFNEDALDKLLDEIKLLGDNLSEYERQNLYRRFSALKLENIRELATVLGTLYDKQALANKEPTLNVGGELGFRKFEDIPE